MNFTLLFTQVFSRFLPSVIVDFFCFSKSSSFLSCEVCVTTWVFSCHPSFLPHVTRLEIKEPELFPSSKNSSMLFFCLPIHHGAAAREGRLPTNISAYSITIPITLSPEALQDEGFLWFSDNSVTWILKAEMIYESIINHLKNRLNKSRIIFCP